MEKVQFLLAKTDTPISAIAALCGYRSGVALRKAFGLFTGKFLADWRKANGRPSGFCYACRIMRH